MIRGEAREIADYYEEKGRAATVPVRAAEIDALQENYAAPNEKRAEFNAFVAYAPLRKVLEQAYNRAASGKGRERHADEQPFVQQPIFAIPRALGGSQDPLLFQAVKKIYESKRLPSPRDEAELLDAIVYLAAAVILMREKRNG